MATQKSTQLSEPEKVDAYMQALRHPRAEVAAALRRLILKTDPAIGEEIKWNAPTFLYTGPLPPFKPKTYRRVLVVFNFFKPDCIRLVFWGASQVMDPSGLLTGDYADGRPAGGD